MKVQEATILNNKFIEKINEYIKNDHASKLPDKAIQELSSRITNYIP